MATDPSATLLVPEGWTRHDRGSLTELVAPEADLSLVFLAAREAPDARAAVAAAWADYRGKETHPFKLEAPMPPGNGGWDELKQIVYQTSPAEHRTVAAYAARKGPAWSVAIIDGNNGTLEKRLGHINAILGSRQAPGHARENFSGRAAHRLDPRAGGRARGVRPGRRGDARRARCRPGAHRSWRDRLRRRGGGARAGPARTGRRRTPASWWAPTPRAWPRCCWPGWSTKASWTGTLPSPRSIRPSAWAATRPRARSSSATWSARSPGCRARTTSGCSTRPPKPRLKHLRPARRDPADEPVRRGLPVQQPHGSAAGYVGAHVAHPGRELGEAFDAAMQEMIFDPLAMNDTTFSIAAALAGDHASPHGKDSDGKAVRSSATDDQQHHRAHPPGRRRLVLAARHDPLRPERACRGRAADGRAPRLAREPPSAPHPRRADGRGPVVRHGPVGGRDLGRLRHPPWRRPARLPQRLFAIPSAQIGAVVLTNPAPAGSCCVRSCAGLWRSSMTAGPRRRRTRGRRPADRGPARRRAQAAHHSGRRGRRCRTRHAYANPDLGPLAVERAGDAVRFRTPPGPATSHPATTTTAQSRSSPSILRSAPLGSRSAQPTANRPSPLVTASTSTNSWPWTTEAKPMAPARAYVR